MDNPEDLIALLNEKVIFGDSLVLKLETIKDVDGVKKLQRKIKQETEFLRKVSQGAGSVKLCVL